MSMYAAARAIDHVLGPSNKRARAMVGLLRANAKKATSGTTGQPVDAAMLLIATLSGATSVRRGAGKAGRYADLTCRAIENPDQERDIFDDPKRQTFSDFINLCLKRPDIAEQHVAAVVTFLDAEEAHVVMVNPKSGHADTYVFLPPGEASGTVPAMRLCSKVEGPGLAEVANQIHENALGRGKA